MAGSITEKSAAAKRSLPVLRRGLRDSAAAGRAGRGGARGRGQRPGRGWSPCSTSDYPSNLRLIPNLPPFLFYRGELQDDDARSVAVVGTRNASDDGIRRAARMSQAARREGRHGGLRAWRGASTLPRTAPRWTAGGRTIAVLGTGITRCYPAENRDLAEEITGSGALVSQFWPTSPPGKYTFPRRNVVTSGISQGTVVIEASSTSGAKMQARLALEHGKKVFLCSPWSPPSRGPGTTSRKRGAIEVADVDEVSGQLAEPDRVRRAAEQHQQLTLSLPVTAGCPHPRCCPPGNRSASRGARRARTSG